MSKLVSKIIPFTKYLLNEAKPKAKVFWYYARVELAPPSPKEIFQVKNEFRNLRSAYREGRWKNLTVKEAFLNTLVTIEVGCWFFIGECIGKGRLVGYNV